MNRKALLVTAIVALTATVTQQTLAVYNLEALGEERSPAYLDIKYSIANYGFAPYHYFHPGSARLSSLS